MDLNTTTLPDLFGIKSIKLSLLEKKSDPDSKNKANYLKKATAKYTLPENFPLTEEAFENIVSEMYIDLKNQKVFADYIGIWVQYNNIVIENAMAINTLEDIKKYAKREINPIYEFFKMTIK